MITMELPPQNTEVEASEEEAIDYEVIRQELVEYRQKEIDKELPTAHLVDVDLAVIPEKDIAFWKQSRELANKVKEMYKNPEAFSEVDFWQFHDEVRALEKRWQDDYYRHQQPTTSEGRFIAFLANTFVVAEGYMSLIEKHRNHEAVEHLAEFKQRQSDPEAQYRTAYLADTNVEDLLESDLHTYQILRAVEDCERRLADMQLLDRARAYAYQIDEALLTGLDSEQEKIITEYASLSERLRRQWDSWHDVEKLDQSRYDFYNYVGNRVQVIAGNQELS